MENKEIIVVGCVGDGIAEISKKLLKAATNAPSGCIVAIEHEDVELPRPFVKALIKRMDYNDEINIEKIKPSTDWKKSGKPKKWRMK